MVTVFVTASSFYLLLPNNKCNLAWMAYYIFILNLYPSAEASAENLKISSCLMNIGEYNFGALVSALGV